MQFYSVLTDLDYDLLEIFFGKISVSTGTFGINGIQSANGSWYAYNPDPKPLYTTGLNLTGPGGCLLVDISGGPKITIKSDLCNRTAHSVCEF